MNKENKKINEVYNNYLDQMRDLTLGSHEAAVAAETIATMQKMMHEEEQHAKEEERYKDEKSFKIKSLVIEVLKASATVVVALVTVGGRMKEVEYKTNAYVQQDDKHSVADVEGKYFPSLPSKEHQKVMNQFFGK